MADPFGEQIETAIRDPEIVSSLVEACVATHFRRYFATYYIKAEGEVDIAYVDQDRFWPIEVKWTKQLRSKDLKQIGKYANGKIWAKSLRAGTLENTPFEPLPLALYEMNRKISSQ